MSLTIVFQSLQQIWREQANFASFATPSSTTKMILLLGFVEEKGKQSTVSARAQPEPDHLRRYG